MAGGPLRPAQRPARRHTVGQELDGPQRQPQQGSRQQHRLPPPHRDLRQEEVRVPARPFPTATYTGRLFDLTDPAQAAEEKKAAAAAGERSGFLTALGPGLPAFAHFQPYNTNVFSFQDPGLDVFETDYVPYTLSYLVTGWYSAPGDDPLAPSGTPLPDLLDRLGWAPPGSPVTRRSVYTGTVLGLDWYPYMEYGGETRKPPPSRCPDNLTGIRVTVGDTVADSATALWAPPAPAGAGPGTALAALEAFTHGWLLGGDEPVTTADHETSAHLTRFRTAPDAGYRWSAADRPSTAPTGPPTPQDTALEQRILTRLNADQYRFDTALFLYRELLHRLHDAWLLAGRAYAPADYRALLDGSDASSLLSRTAQQLTDLFGTPGGTGGLRSAVPWGATPEAFERSVDGYEREAGLPAHRHLVRTPLPPFHRPQTTAVTIHGLTSDDDPTPAGTLPCRTRPDLITAVEGVTVPPAPPAPPLPVLPTDVASLLQPLLREFQLLDAARQKNLLDRINADPGQVTGRVPACLRDWRQPWQPLFIRWKAQVTPLPHRTGDGIQHWSYDHGANRYRWDGKDSYTEGVPGTGWQGDPLTGLNHLDPVYAVHMAGRTAQHTATHPRTTPPDAGASGLDALSFPLEGLRERLLRRTPGRPLRPPADAEPAVLGRLLGTYSPRDSPDCAAADFTPVRAAQFTLRGLEVIDRFGRALTLFGEANYRRFTGLDIAEPLRTPDDADLLAQGENHKITAQLQPRLATGARLRFDGIGTDDETTVIDPARGWDPDNHPVCGWIMLSRLGGSLLLYGPGGQGLAEMRTVRRKKQHITVWQPLPGSPYRTLDTPAFRQDLPRLHGLAAALHEPDGRRLDSLLAHLARNLTGTPDTPGLDARHLALLLGRPLALLRTRPRLETDTLAPTDPRDAALLGRPPTGTPPDEWTVRLGNPAHTGDGLIGHLPPSGPVPAHLCVPGDTAQDPTGFLQPAAAPAHRLALRARPVTGDDLAKSGDHARPATDLLLTLLADPFAAVQADTAVLPTAALTLPPRYLAQAFRGLTAYFRLGPLLAPAPPGDELAIVTPRPAWSGMRTWVQPPRPGSAQTGPQDFSLTPYTTTAYNTPPPEARTGHLAITVPNDQD